MKFLVTMNMPSNQGFSVHQITIDYPVNSCRELCDVLNEEEFILCRQYYRRQNDFGELVWLDKGDMVVNTAHIGKIQEFIEYQREFDDDSGSETTRPPQNTRGPLRVRRGSV